MSTIELGRYQIAAEIGRGAMGVVYKAVDPMLNRTVALKTVNLFQDDEERLEYEARFYQEGKAAGGLNHPGIVTIYDIGKTGTTVFMAMEYVDGRELRDLIAGGARLPVARTLDIIAQVAEGLAFAHERGVVHRDVKPANVMITAEGRAKIMDFGIARMRSAEVRTQTGVVLGSPKYMSPEQVLGRRVDPRTDIFSLGVVLYEMLVGVPPFAGEDLNSIMYNIVNANPPPPSALNAAVPAMLDLIVAKALAKTPESRYAEAGQLAADLRECVRAVPVDTEEGFFATTAGTVRLDVGPTGTQRLEPAGIASATQTMSRRFDSFAATRRLAAAAGREGAAAASHTLKVEPLQRRPRKNRPASARWSAADTLAFGVSVTIACVAAALIALG